MDSLMEETVPGLSFAVFKRSIAVCLPFLEKHSSAILLTKEGTQSFFKAATEDHRCPGLFFPPAIQIPVAIAAGALAKAQSGELSMEDLEDWEVSDRVGATWLLGRWCPDDSALGGNSRDVCTAQASR